MDGNGSSQAVNEAQKEWIARVTAQQQSPEISPPIPSTVIAPQHDPTAAHLPTESVSAAPLTATSTPTPNPQRTTHNAQHKPVDDQIIDINKNPFGHIVSADIEIALPKSIARISSLFFFITFIYATLTLLLFGVIIALSIALANSGIPGFLYLKYYPTVGIVPTLTSIATLVFLYIAWQMKDGSRLSWFLGVVSLALIPVSFSIVLPIMAQPLVKIVSVYAGSPEKPLPVPQLSVESIGHFFTLFLAVELILIVLLVTMRKFTFPFQPLSANGKTALVVVFLLLFLPVNAAVGYGYYQSYYSDFGYRYARDAVPYHIYTLPLSPGSREYASHFSTNEDLAGFFNAIKVSYDIPLPTIIKTGANSRITIKQVEVPHDFDYQKFLARQERGVDNDIQTISLANSLDGKGYIIRYGGTTTIWMLMQDFVLVSLSSTNTDKDTLTTAAQSLY